MPILTPPVSGTFAFDDTEVMLTAGIRYTYAGSENSNELVETETDVLPSTPAGSTIEAAKSFTSADVTTVQQPIRATTGLH